MYNTDFSTWTEEQFDAEIERLSKKPLDLLVATRSILLLELQKADGLDSAQVAEFVGEKQFVRGIQTAFALNLIVMRAIVTKCFAEE